MVSLMEIAAQVEQLPTRDGVFRGSGGGDGAGVQNSVAFGESGATTEGAGKTAAGSTKGVPLGEEGQSWLEAQGLGVKEAHSMPPEGQRAVYAPQAPVQQAMQHSFGGQGRRGEGRVEEGQGAMHQSDHQEAAPQDGGGHRRKQLQWVPEEDLQQSQPQPLGRRGQRGVRRRLMEEVYRRLKKAVDASLIQHELLRQLLADLCQPIGTRAQGILAAEEARGELDARGGGQGETEVQGDVQGFILPGSKESGQVHSTFSRLEEEGEAEGEEQHLLGERRELAMLQGGPGHAQGAYGTCAWGHVEEKESTHDGVTRGSSRTESGSDSASSSSSSSSSRERSRRRNAEKTRAEGVAVGEKQSSSHSSVAASRSGSGEEGQRRAKKDDALVPSAFFCLSSRACFYQLLAEQYGREEVEAAPLLPLFSSLWSSEFTSQIFALLLHQWVYLCPENHTEAMLRYCRASLNGSDALFWIDLGSNERRFSPLFDFLMNEVLLTTTRFARVPPLFQNDMVRLVARFIFLYHPDGGVLELMTNEGLEDVLLGSPVHLIVSEITNQLQRIKVEEVLIQFLRATEQLKGVEIPMTTGIRLQVVLHSLTAAGGPLFPTGRVRRNARRALDSLFPVGRRFRYIISLFFRLLHPLFWPTSVLSYAVSLFYKLLGSAQKAFRRIMEPRHSAFAYNYHND